MPIAIKVENVSKVYRLGTIGTGTLGNDLKRWYARTRGKEDPFLKIGEVNDRTVKGHSDIVWSLRGINFEVEQGEAVGIIGRNGAGKSTLLKILSRVTGPTTGKVTGDGRVASLLEVGTGFHPELTGRDNIYLNGAILGMRKKEIKKKFDDIVEFAGVQRYIDTPVKRYSSGMYVRLAFAVAAHLESEILIVDEVLAVGDADFQRKCLGKMNEVSKGEGRTVLFVSHNLAAVKQLCNKGILLINGEMREHSVINNVVRSYIEENISNSLQWIWTTDKPKNENIELNSVNISPAMGKEVTVESRININISFQNKKENINLAVSIFILTSENQLLFETGIILSENKDSKIGTYKLSCSIPPNILNTGIYKINLLFGENQKYILFSLEDIVTFEIQETYIGRGSNLNKVPGLIRPYCVWEQSYEKI